MTFRISALPITPFVPLFDLSDEELRQLGARRCVADSKPGFPCRVSLKDAEVGETLLLVNYEHQTANSPYRASHAIYIRKGATQAKPADGEIPDVLRSRLLSVRGFDKDGMMMEADVIEGRKLDGVIEKMLGNEKISYLHLHNAKPGCYAARVDRA